MIFTIVPLVILFVLFAVSYVQYLRHRAPLKAIDPSVHYGYFHHISIVTIPMLKYRFQAKFKPSKPVIPSQPTQNS